MAASVLNDLVAVLTPVPVLTPEEYDGWQYRWKAFVFRPACNFIPIVSESKFISQFNSVEDRDLSSRGSFALLLICILGFNHKFKESEEMARTDLPERIKPSAAYY